MSTRSSDLNLLFGIIALQTNFITREQLVAAFDCWVHDKSRDFGQILLATGALTIEDRDALKRLVARFLEKHGGDAERSLAAISSVPQIRPDLERLADVDLGASLGHVGQDLADDGCLPTTLDSSVNLGGRFRILRPHAKGGLGQVSVALDQELHREVALKEILIQHSDDVTARERFVLEAEITGGLEHPGIVPVYALGQSAEGRPYYAMRFVKGDSLKEAIEQFHRPDNPNRKDAGTRQLQLRQLLGRFIDVCNAMEYAHSRGVLHRDLKPGNIMVGKYGETLVVDWGLAKALGTRTVHRDDPTLRPASALSSSVQTQAGSAIGTPAYMSPEQAAGKLEDLGPTTDVYSLGATLYHLLCGQQPFEKENLGDLLRKVQKGEFARPRTVVAQIPRGLEAICLKAMALQPPNRYQSAMALAADIEHWLADEAVSAWREPASVRVGRWIRKNKPLVSGIAAALLVSLVAGTVGFAWYRDQQARRATELVVRRQSIQAALDGTQRSRDELHEVLARSGGVFELLNEPARWQSHLNVAQASLDHAKALAAEAVESEPAIKSRIRNLESLLASDERDRVIAERLDKIRLDRLVTTEGHNWDYGGADRDYPLAFADAGFQVADETPRHLADRITPSSIKEQLLAALDDWAFVEFKLGNINLVDKLLETSRLSTPGSAWSSKLRRSEIWRDPLRLATSVTDDTGAIPSRQLCSLVGELLTGPESEAWLRKAQGWYPDDFWLNRSLALAIRFSKPVESEGFLRAALAVRPRSSEAYNGLGQTLQQQQRLAEAIVACRRAIELMPGNVRAHNTLGDCLLDQQEFDEAMVVYQRAIELDPNNIYAHGRLIQVYRAQNRPDEIAVTLQKAIKLMEKTVELDPKNVSAYRNMVDLLGAQGKADEAIAASEKVVELDPKDGRAYRRLGDLLGAQGKVDEAIIAFRHALELNPADAQLSTHLANVLRDRGRNEEALQYYQQAIVADPKNVSAYRNLVDLLGAQGEVDEAIIASEKVVELDPKDVAAYRRLGDLRSRQGRVDEAITAYEKVVELDPKDGRVYRRLGDLLGAQGKVDEAIIAFRHALELNPADAQLSTHLANVLRDHGRNEEALQYYQQAIAADPKIVSAYRNLGDLLGAQGKVDEAIIAFRHAQELNPADAQLSTHLANVLRDRGRNEEALQYYQQAIAADPKYAEGHLHLGKCQLKQRNVREAIRAFEKAVEFNPKLSEAHLLLGMIHHEQHRPAEALAAYEKAVEFDPKNSTAQNSLAWFLATCTVDRYRDGARAIEHGLLACKLTEERNYLFLDTLAAAYAEAGQFDEAVRYQRRIIEILESANNGRDFRKRLQLYEQKQPYRE